MKKKRKILRRSPQERLAYSLAEGAAMIGVSVHTLRRDARTGAIRTARYGRRRLIPAAELRRLAEKGL